MSGADAGPAGGLRLRLMLPGGSAPALGTCLVGELELTATAPIDVPVRLNLIESDVWIDVSGPGGAARIAWPWPADSGMRTTHLTAGESLVAAVPLFATDTSAPVLPAPGRYALTPHSAVGPLAEITGTAVAVSAVAGEAAATRALADREVIQSLLSAGVLGAAAPGLEVLARSDHAATRALANLALGHPVESGSADAARAVAAVLPPFASVPDPRRDAVLAEAAEPRVRAMLTGEAIAAERSDPGQE